MKRRLSTRGVFSLLLPMIAFAFVVVLGAWQAGCGKGGGNTFDTPDGSGPGDNGDGASGSFLDGGGQSDSPSLGLGDGAPSGILAIQPPAAIIDVSIDSTGIHATPVPFVASSHGTPIVAAWSFDRAELGTVAATTGVFTANGKTSGDGIVTAAYGGVEATAKVTVRIHNVQIGAPPGGGGADAGATGNGGVGGEGLGGPVDSATIGRLRHGGIAGGSSADLAFLYPYDRTVWPRGILAPLLQWKTTHSATAVYIHVKQTDFEFEGFYAGNKLVHQPIDATAWYQALEGNTGDSLHVEVTIADATTVWGPVAEDWLVAPGVLKGTLYYNSYNTTLATKYGAEQQAAAVLAIKSTANGTALSVAIPGTENHRCVVCHTLSADGSTLFAEEASGPWPAYGNSASYDLRNGGALIKAYTGNAPDGTTNNRKFLWSGPSPDGTYALQSSGHTQESYGVEDSTQVGANVDSRLFRRDNGNALTATGFDGVVKEAVTPSFSPDGSRIAFSYWTSAAAPGTGPTAGDGHTLDVMDFKCGAGGGGAGAPSCGTFTFSNLRRLYTNPDSTNGFPAWPGWLPDGSGLVFHNTILPPTTTDDSPISTWNGAQAELWYVDVPASGVGSGAIPMSAINGKSAAQASYLPTNALHPDDTHLNYEPTVNPVASGGYYWVVFTSRRMYGNIASGDPYEIGDGTYPVTKKLWVAAIDLHPVAGKDPSHPAFYLPGQEINAGNMRGFWVVDPCKANGSGCDTGDECCNGFCRSPDDGGAPVCQDKPPQGCAQEFEKCTTTGDCCGAASGFQCLNGHCARPTPK